MVKNNISMTVKNLKAMRDNPQKDTIDFDSPIQRKSGMWDEKRKSLLIHSILMGSLYSVPTVYFRKDMLEDKKYQYSVIDGIQRITTIFSYIDNEFSLTEVPPVIVDGVTYDVSGMYFKDLETDLQQEIVRFKLKIEAFEPESGDTEEYVNNTIEEIFSRINSAVPLTSAQLCKAKAGTDVAILINEMLSSKFFTEGCCFTKGQLKASDDQRCLLQLMMILDMVYTDDFELKDFSEKSIMEYAESIKGVYSDKQVNVLKAVVEFLTDAFPEKDKQLKKINVPIVGFIADYAMDKEIKPRYFRNWFEFFTEEDELFETYKTFCSSGSTRIDKVEGRLVYALNSFVSYFETDYPDYMMDMKLRVEEKVRERLEAEQESSGESDSLESNEAVIENAEDEILESETSEGETQEDETSEDGASKNESSDNDVTMEDAFGLQDQEEELNSDEAMTENSMDQNSEEASMEMPYAEEQPA